MSCTSVRGTAGPRIWLAGTTDTRETGISSKRNMRKNLRLAAPTHSLQASSMQNNAGRVFHNLVTSPYFELLYFL